MKPTHLAVLPTARHTLFCGLAVLAFIASGSLRAQSCDAPLAFAPNSSAAASTCGSPGAEPSTVFRFTLEQPYVVDFSLAGGPGFDPALCVVDAADPCNTRPCLAAGSRSRPLMQNSLPAGTYWLIVAATPDSAPGTCGSFMLANEATPLDVVYANGFD
jgi:hypothetical protein